MKIYIASSWKNQHAVEMLTNLLRQKGCEVISFVEKAVCDEGRSEIKFDVERWIASDDGKRKFQYDLDGATKSNLVIYIGPSGTDAWAEVGAAWASGVPIWGLHSKGEQAGLMRRMVNWYFGYEELVEAVELFLDESCPCNGTGLIPTPDGEAICRMHFDPTIGPQDAPVPKKHAQGLIS